MGILYVFITPLLIGIFLYQFSPALVDFEPRAYKVAVFDTLSGALKENNRLGNGERLFEGKIFGPESLAVHGGSIYTGTSDGCITKITGNDMTCLIKLKKDCEKGHCSRPLGMRFDKAGKLYVADCELGFFSVDIKTGAVTPLIKIEEKVGGKPVTFPDDLSISSDGVIYFSDASVKWKPSKVGLAVMEHDDSGRIIQFDTKTKKSSVLVDGLCFANGVQLSKSEDSLLISETFNHRILRHYLKGDKKGQTEVFADLPGHPDNIRASKNGYWVALVNYHNPKTSGLMESLSEYPFVRKVIVRIQQTTASIIQFVNKYWNSQHLGNFARELQDSVIWSLPSVRYGMAVEIDENGKFIQSIQSPDGRNTFLSEILEHDGYLYAGSFLNPYLIRMKNSVE